MSNIVPYGEHHSLQLPSRFTSERGVTIEALIAAWLHEKESHSHSAKTKRAYETTLNDFRHFLQSQRYDLIWQGDDFVPMIADFAQAFAGTRSERSRHKGNVSPATQAQRLAILSSFYLYLIKRRHILTSNPLDVVDRPSVKAYDQADAIEQEEIEVRLKEINKNTLQGARDLALLLVLLQTGRRVSEVAGLTRGNIKITGRHLKITFERTKGNDEMRDTLPVSVSKVLTIWLETFYKHPLKDISESMPVWVNTYHQSHYGEPLGYHGVAGVCKHYLGTSKVHTTRHTFALLMELAGAKLTDIQQRLGHKNAATTGIYMQKLTRDKNVHAEKLASLLGFEDKE